MNSDNPDNPDEPVKTRLLAALAAAHERLVAAADQGPADGRAQSADWGAREVLAHIAAWESEALRRIPLLLSGAPDVSYDVGAFNAQAIAGVCGQSVNDVRETLDQVHLRLVEYLEGLDESAFVEGGAAREWVEAQARHSLEHARELEQLR